MIDFSTLQSLTIPEGVVTQITDAAGRVIWKLRNNKPIILEVEKITSNTYAGETTYTGEQFILLDIYPKTNGTVSVTYGGLTKTITDTSGSEEPNAQQVFFGTFNGVTDSIDTPTSGTLTIEGECYAFSIGTFASSSKISNSACFCITAITDFGNVIKIPDNAFFMCKKIKNVTVPQSVVSIGSGAFLSCDAIEAITFLSTTPPILVYNGSSYNHFITTTSNLTLTYPLIVPKGCSSIYKAADVWSAYADRIVEAS